MTVIESKSLQWSIRDWLFDTEKTLEAYNMSDVRWEARKILLVERLTDSNCKPELHHPLGHALEGRGCLELRTIVHASVASRKRIEWSCFWGGLHIFIEWLQLYPQDFNHKAVEKTLGVAWLASCVVRHRSQSGSERQKQKNSCEGFLTRLPSAFCPLYIVGKHYRWGWEMDALLSSSIQ